MNVVFPQRIWRELLGPMSLSAVLREAGHRTRAVIAQTVPRLARETLDARPDAVALYWGSDDHRFLTALVSALKTARPDLPIIAGGPHPTLVPGLIESVPIDAACQGEGEAALLEWVEARSRGSHGAGIPNLRVRTPEGIVDAPVRRLCADLDSLPDPDRDLYDGFALLRTNPQRVFMAGRGCPFDCTFCATPTVRRLYRGAGPFLRCRSPDRVLGEISAVASRGRLRTVRFEDDTFSQDRRWLFPFLERYQREIGLPFVCYVRADQVDDELASRLVAAGCTTVCFGVETGDAEIRNRLLGKALPDAALIAAADTLRRHRLRFYTTSMFGLPGETLDQAWKTVELNRRLAPDDVWSSVFQPYPGLPLTETAIAMGLISRPDVQRVDSRPFHGNGLAQPDSRALFNLQKLFLPIVKSPPGLDPLWKRWVRAPTGPLNRPAFLAAYAWSAARHARLDPLRLAWEGAHWLRFFWNTRD
jgi:radical SAM superfamily enzyme YgiQ (UPF0313 family)